MDPVAMTALCVSVENVELAPASWQLDPMATFTGRWPSVWLDSAF